MKVLAFSDSHGRNLAMLDAVDRERPEAVFHLGDHASDAREMASLFPQTPVYFVRGNNDWDDGAPWHLVVTLEGVPVFLCHGHRQQARQGYQLIAQQARDAGCQAAFFGHTHLPCDTWLYGVHLLNPGSASLPWQGPPGYLRLRFEKGELQAGLVFLEK